MSVAATGRAQSSETKTKRSISLRGHKWSEESREKMRKPKSEATKQRMSEAAIARNAAMRLPRVVANINKQ